MSPSPKKAKSPQKSGIVSTIKSLAVHTLEDRNKEAERRLVGPLWTWCVREPARARRPAAPGVIACGLGTDRPVTLERTGKLSHTESASDEESSTRECHALTCTCHGHTHVHPSCMCGQWEKRASGGKTRGRNDRRAAEPVRLAEGRGAEGEPYPP